jgi:hypothetical protein
MKLVLLSMMRQAGQSAVALSRVAHRDTEKNPKVHVMTQWMWTVESTESLMLSTVSMVIRMAVATVGTMAIMQLGTMVALMIGLMA